MTPAHAKYQHFEYERSCGLTKIFIFSLTHTTIDVNGKFMNTVIGYDLNNARAPSFLQISLIHLFAETFVNYILYLMTSDGAMKKSWANVVEAPIAILWNRLWEFSL